MYTGEIMFNDKNEKIVVNANNRGIAVGKAVNSNIIVQTSKVGYKEESFIKKIIRVMLNVWTWFKK